MLQKTVTVGCCNSIIGNSRAIAKVLLEAGCSVSDNSSRINFHTPSGNIIKLSRIYGYLAINGLEHKKIIKIDVKEIEYNYNPVDSDDFHSSTVEVTIPDFTTAEDFDKRVLHISDEKIPGKNVDFNFLNVGEVIETPIDNEIFLEYKVTAIGVRNFLAIDENGDEKMFPKMDGFWFYV